ncbi:hypothetical protein THARTR1_07763 [Trichoderma harzianum]|uniref:Uncharacterized protein n=1 Tax=Trichoderma harzianum TaxID=5544 RepID=A0A2K0U1J5_TRIHA|nr:hypothetical protein THARTR1_07763 [Trichoderma harzianum]
MHQCFQTAHHVYYFGLNIRITVSNPARNTCSGSCPPSSSEEYIPLSPIALALSWKYGIFVTARSISVPTPPRLPSRSRPNPSIIPSRTGKLAGLGALSALFTLSNSISLVPSRYDDEEEAHFNADLAISACALVGGLKLESRTTNLRTPDAGRETGSAPACGRVQRMRKTSGDE